MNSILASIRPKWVMKILDGDKTIEVRKTAPKDWVDYLTGKTDKKPESKTVYIYCTKGGNEVGKYGDDRYHEITDDSHWACGCSWNLPTHCLNGKVVAKFTLRKVEEFIQGLNEAEYENLPNFALKDYDYHGLEDLMEKACLNDEKINEYAPDLSFYAWHISDLVIFDRPMELSEFKHPFPHCGRYCDNNLIPSFCKDHCSHNTDPERLNVWCDRYDKWGEPLTKAPQSWCYVEESK